MPKEEQVEIPGTEAPRIKEIDKAADKYVEVRDTRMDWTKKETEAREKLIETVLANADKIVPTAGGERIYRYGEDMEVVLKVGKPNVKVKHVAAGEDEQEP